MLTSRITVSTDKPNVWSNSRDADGPNRRHDSWMSIGSPFMVNQIGLKASLSHRSATQSVTRWSEEPRPVQWRSARPPNFKTGASWEFAREVIEVLCHAETVCARTSRDFRQITELASRNLARMQCLTIDADFTLQVGDVDYLPNG